MSKDHVFDQQQHFSRETCNPLEGGVDGSGLERCCANIVSENIVSPYQLQQICREGSSFNSQLSASICSTQALKCSPLPTMSPPSPSALCLLDILTFTFALILPSVIRSHLFLGMKWCFVCFEHSSLQQPLCVCAQEGHATKTALHLKGDVVVLEKEK